MSDVRSRLLSIAQNGVKKTEEGSDVRSRLSDIAKNGVQKENTATASGIVSSASGSNDRIQDSSLAKKREAARELYSAKRDMASAQETLKKAQASANEKAQERMAREAAAQALAGYEPEPVTRGQWRQNAEDDSTAAARALLNDAYARKRAAQIKSAEASAEMGAKESPLQPVSVPTLDEAKYQGVGNKVSFAQQNKDYIRTMAASPTDIDSAGLNLEELSRLSYLTEQEAEVYNWYLQNRGEKAAEDYLSLLDREINARISEEESAKAMETAKKNKALGVAGDISMGYLTWMGNYAGARQALKNAATGEYEPMDPNEGGMRFVNVQNAIKEGIVGDIKNPVARKAADIGLNVAENVSRYPLGPLGMAAMTGGAAATEMNAATRDGATTGQALTKGVIAGAAEYVTEKMGMDRFADAVSGKAKGEAVKFVVSTLFPEFMEESASEYINRIADNVIMGSASEMEKYKRELMAGGMSEADADREAKIEFWIKQPLQAGIEGAISGGLITSFGVAANKIIDRKNDRLLENIGGQLSEAGVVEDVIATGLESAEETESNRLAQQLREKLDAGEEVSNAEVGRLYAENIRAVSEEETSANDDSAQKTEAESEADTEDVKMSEGETEAAQEASQKETEEPVNNVVLTQRDRILAAASAIDEEIRKQRNDFYFSDAEKRFGESGKKAFASFYRNTEDFGEYYNGFSGFYEAGMANIPIEKVSEIYSGNLPSAVQQAAYMAGANDAEASLAKDKSSAAVFYPDGKLVESEYTKNLTGGERALFNTLAQATGNEIHLVGKDSLIAGKDANGNTVYADGSYLNGWVNIELSSEDAMRVVVSHEVLHGFQKTAPAEYRLFRNYAVQMAEKANGSSVSAVEQKKRQYDTTTEKAMDELAADFTRTLFKDRKEMHRFIEKNIDDVKGRSMLQKFFDLLDDVIQKIKKAFSGNKAAMDEAAYNEYGLTMAELEQARQLWLDALKETNRKVKEAQGQQSKEVEAVNGNAYRSGTSYSIKNNVIDVNGKEYGSVVVLDYDVFKKVSRNGKLYVDFVRNNLIKEKITVYNSEGVPEVIEFAAEKERVKKDGAKNSHPVIGELTQAKSPIKKLVILNAAETAQISALVEHNSENSHKWLDSYGWDKRSSYVMTKDGTIYPVTLHIAKTRDGRNILYDVNVQINEGVAIDRNASPLPVKKQAEAAVKVTTPSVESKVTHDGNNVKKYFLKDSDYLKSVENGDMETAQKMVDEAAKSAGYDIKAWHGSRYIFNEFRKDKRGSNTGTKSSEKWFFAGDKDTANSYYPYGVMKELARTNPNIFKESDAEKMKQKGKLYELYLRMENPLIVDVAGYDYASHVKSKDAMMEYVEQAERNGNDGIILYNVRDNQLRPAAEESTVYMFRDSNQAKSAEPVTYDDNGNVIPLSKRFDSSNEDIRFSMKKPVEEIDTHINSTMTMALAKDMVQRAFVLGGIKEWFEGEYKTGDEWLKGEGTDAVAVVIDNEWQLQERFLNKIIQAEEKNGSSFVYGEDYMTEDILEAYLNGTLTGGVEEKPVAKRLDVSQKTTATDNRFYAPKQIADAKQQYEIALQRVTNKNRDEVYAARAKVIMFAHTRGAAEALGLTQAELNKKLSQWARYNARARDTSMRFNANVADFNKWTGIENSSILNRITVSKDELDSLVGTITGDNNGHQRNYIMRTMLAIDSHIDYSGLNFEFVGRPDSNRSGVNGLYSNSERKIRVKYNAPNTVAHEMGHFIDYQWARDIGVGGALTDGHGRNSITDPDVKQWLSNFDAFKISLEDVSDIRSGYSMDAKEVFARFVARFVQWVDNTATGNRNYNYEVLAYNDKFTASQYIEFVRLLQEKSLIDSKKMAAEQEATRFSRKVRDTESERRYNKFGWAKENNVLGRQEFAVFLKRIGDLNRGEYFRETFDGYYMIPTGKKGVDKYIVFTDGGMEEASIECVIKFNSDNETDFGKFREAIYEAAERSAEEYIGTYGLYEDAGIALGYAASDYSLYTKHQATGRRSDGEFSWRDFKSFTGEQYGRGSSGEGERFSIKGTSDILKQNAKLKEYNEYLKSQMKLTKEVKVDKKALERFAKSLVKEYGSSMESTELFRQLDEMYTYMQNAEEISWGEMKSMSLPVARNILSEATVVNDELYRSYKDLRQYLRETGITLPDAYKNDISSGYNDFRKANYGRIHLVNDGTSVDVIYQELADMYPEFFDAERYTNPAEQLEHIAEVLDSLRPYEENPYSSAMDEAADWLSNDIIEKYFDMPVAKPTFADRQKAKLDLQKQKDAEKLQRLRDQKNRRIEEIKAQSRERVQEILKNERSKKYDAVAKVRENQKAKEARMSDKRKRSVLVSKIRKHVEKMQKMLLSPTDTSHVPEALKKPVSEFLLSVDLKTGRMGKKTIDRLNDAKDKYQEILDGKTDYYMDVDPDMMDNINQVLKSVKERPGIAISEMSLDDLTALYHAALAMERSVYSYNKLLSDGKYAEVSEYGERVLSENYVEKGYRESANGAKQFFDDLLNMHMLSPADYFEELGKSMSDLWGNIRSGFDTKVRLTKTAIDYMSELKGKTDIRGWTGKRAKTTTFSMENGQTITLTPAQVMSLYLLDRQPDAQKHIYDGGIKASPIVIRSGKSGTPKVLRSYDVVSVTKADVQNILKSMTPEQRRIAEGISRFFTEYTAEWGNEVSMQLYGYRKFTVDNYFPIVADTNYLKEVFGETNDATLKNMGITKRRNEDARNAIIIEDAFEVYARQADQMASYNAFVVPLNDIQKVYNYKNREGAGSVKGAIGKKFGTRANKYFQTIMTDINGGAQYRGGIAWMNNAIGKYKQARIGLNARVVIQQPTAYFRAAAMIHPKYLAEAMVKPVKLDTVLQYAPIAQWKMWGFYSLDTGKSMQSLILGEKESADYTMWAAGKADEITWKRIWAAVELETQDKHKELTPGTEEYYEFVGKRFSEIIDRTQVVDSTIHRTQIMRNPDTAVKMSVSFMSEPMKSYNLLRTTFRNAALQKTPAAYKAAGAAAGAYLSSIVVNNFVTGFIDAMRGDDDDEFLIDKVNEWFKKLTKNGRSDDDQEEEGGEKLTFRERWYKHFIDNLINEPMSMIPIVKDGISLFQGFSVKRMDMAGLGDLVSALKRANSDKYTMEYKVIDVSSRIADLFGVPASSVKREIESFTKTLLCAKDDPVIDYKVSRYFYSVTANKSKYMDILFNALKKEDRESYDYLVKQLIHDGLTPKYIENSMKTRWKKDSEMSGDFDSYGVMDALAGAEFYYQEPEKEPEFSIDDLTSDQYAKYSEENSEIVMGIIDEFRKSGFGKLDAETANNLLSAAYSYAEKVSLEDASGGQYEIDVKWINEAKNSESRLGLSAAEYIMLKEEYGSSALTAEGVQKAYEAGISPDTYLEIKDNLDDLKADKDENGNSISGTRKAKVVDYLNTMGLTEEEYGVLMEAAGYENPFK